MLHDLVTLTVAVLLLWALASPRVPTGVLPTIGIGVLLVGTLWSLDDGAPGAVVVDVFLGGLGLIGAGLLRRCYKHPKRRMRRSTDWMPTHPGEISRDHQVASERA
jgi:hypothetical protein